jgi:hypothetical protein
MIDSQGSGVIMEGNLDVSEAEGYLGRDLASEQMDRDLLVAEVMTGAKRTAPKRQIYLRENVGSEMQQTATVFGVNLCKSGSSVHAALDSDVQYAALDRIWVALVAQQ